MEELITAAQNTTSTAVSIQNQNHESVTNQTEKVVKTRTLHSKQRPIRCWECSSKWEITSNEFIDGVFSAAADVRVRLEFGFPTAGTPSR